MEVRVTKSNKGGEKIFIDNYGYHFRSINANNEYRWVCEHRKSMLCKSLVITKKFGEDHQISKPPTEHNHPGLEHDKVDCKVNNCMKDLAKEEYTVKPSQIMKRVAADVDPLARKEALKIYRIHAEKTQMLYKSDVHLNKIPHSHKLVDIHNGQKCKILSAHSNSSNLEEDKIHRNDGNYDPKHRPIVRSDQESDGTVNIRIFLEESLLRSFVINAHHTSNVNIRISKDNLQQNLKY